MSHSQTGKNAIDNTLLDTAAHWIVRLSSDQCQAVDRLDFSKWIEQHPNNGPAFDQVLETWQAGAHIDASELQPTQKTSTSWFSDWQWSPLRTATASVLFLVAALGLVLQNNLWQAANGNVSELHVNTARGEFKSIILEDGSIIELNTNTEIKSSQDDNGRNFALIRGEAFFNIASDKQRPFVIDLGDATVTVVGTQFNIQRQNSASHILVTEGIVKVAEQSQHSQLPANKARLTAGQKVSIDKRTGLGAVKTVNKDRPIHWRAKTLVFEEATLSDALADLNRYLDKPVDLSDTTLKDLHVSGTFSLEEPQTTLTALIETFGLQSQTNTKGEVSLHTTKDD